MFDSRNANIAFYNSILEHFEKPRLRDEDTDIVHMSTAEESVNYLFQDDPRCDDAQAFRLQIDYEPFIRLMLMEPHLEKVLDSLRDRYHLAVATNRTHTIHTILDIFDLAGYFDLVVSSLDVTRPKPHPEAAFKILEHFAVEGHNTLYVGDSIVDYKVAREACLVFIAYKHPELKAEYHIDDLRKLLSIVSVDER
jgi:phosphoglycolate phosphatase